MFLQYGKGAIAGHQALDNVCFSPKPDSCVESMSFLSVVKAKDMQALKGSGIVGLSPSPARDIDLKEPLTHNTPGFVT